MHRHQTLDNWICVLHDLLYESPEAAGGGDEAAAAEEQEDEDEADSEGQEEGITVTVIGYSTVSTVSQTGSFLLSSGESTVN